MIEPYLISPDVLRNIQVSGVEDKELLLEYTRGLMFGSKTPELRSYWTLVNIWVSKHFITNITEEDDETVS